MPYKVGRLVGKASEGELVCVNVRVHRLELRVARGASVPLWVGGWYKRRWRVGTDDGNFEVEKEAQTSI